MSGQTEAIYALAFSAVLIGVSKLDIHIDDDSLKQSSYALGFGGVGASLGALASSLVVNATPRETRRRVQIHMLIGIPTGIALGYWLRQIFQDVPTWACIFSASSICGWMGVKAMMFAESKLTRKK